MTKWFKENWFLVLMIFVLLVALILSMLLFNHYNEMFGSVAPTENPRADWGVFGDFFGGVLNPIFALFSLFMILVTIFQNQRELTLSRQEFHESKEALQAQAITLEKQRYEDTFFSLLEQHNSLLAKINSREVYYGYDGTPQTGVSDCQMFKDKIFGGIEISLFLDCSTLKQAKAILFNSRISINQYFRVLFQILKFISTNTPTSPIKGAFSIENLRNTTCSTDEKFYSNIVRSFLSENTYLLLAVNCYCENENDIFFSYKSLIERYAFFEHMPLELENIQNKSIIYEIVNHFDPRAFGGNPDYRKILNK